MTATLDLAGAPGVRPLNGVIPPMALTDEDRDELAYLDQAAGIRLEVGQTYQSIGPLRGLKKDYEPAVCTVTAVLATGYRTEGKRQSAPFIAFGCEHYWEPILA